jgi:hypothetical protein
MYVTEFGIPLDLIDTANGPTFAAATKGSVLRFNIVINDQDAVKITASIPQAAGVLWANLTTRERPFSAGEASWLPRLILMPPCWPTGVNCSPLPTCAPGSFLSPVTYKCEACTAGFNYSTTGDGVDCIAVSPPCLLLQLSPLTASSDRVCQKLLFSETFEAISQSSSNTTTPFFVIGSGYLGLWNRAGSFLNNGMPLPSSAGVRTTTGFDGYFFVAENVDESGYPLPVFVTWPAFSITNFTDLLFSVKLAYGTSGNTAYDRPDFIMVRFLEF